MIKTDGHGPAITNGLGDEIIDDCGAGGYSYHQFHHHLGFGHGFKFIVSDGDGDGYLYDTAYVTVLIIDENPMTMLYQTHCMQTTEGSYDQI